MRILIAAAAAATLLASPAAAVGVFTIDFEDQAPLTFVSNPLGYPEATFTSGGDGLYITTTNTNDLCPYIGLDCTGSLTVDFPSAPLFFATDVSFTVSGDDAAGVTGQVEVYRAGALVGTADIVTDDIFDNLDLVDLTSFGEINRIVITTTDPAGLSYDNFSFNILVVDFPVPAPAGLVLFGLGAAALGFARRR